MNHQLLLRSLGHFLPQGASHTPLGSPQLSIPVSLCACLAARSVVRVSGSHCLGSLRPLCRSLQHTSFLLLSRPRLGWAASFSLSLPLGAGAARLRGRGLLRPAATGLSLVASRGVVHPFTPILKNTRNSNRNFSLWRKPSKRRLTWSQVSLAMRASAPAFSLQRVNVGKRLQKETHEPSREPPASQR